MPLAAAAADGRRLLPLKIVLDLLAGHLPVLLLPVPLFRDEVLLVLDVVVAGEGLGNAVTVNVVREVVKRSG